MFRDYQTSTAAKKTAEVGFHSLSKFPSKSWFYNQTLFRVGVFYIP